LPEQHRTSARAYKRGLCIGGNIHSHYAALGFVSTV
jgi:hypothetical protein